MFAQYFVNYLKQVKGLQTEEHNLSLLNMTELVDIVESFREKHPKKKLMREPDIYPEIDIPANMNKVQSWNPKKVYYVNYLIIQSNGAWDYELSGYEECKKEKRFFN